MRVAIIGDSFTKSLKNTWIEKVCSDLNLEIIHQIGFGGMAQYKIYIEFQEVIKKNPEIIICCHTEHSRLYHPTEQIQKYYAFENKDVSQTVKNKELLDASKKYYLHLYDENFSRYIHNSLIKSMQKICKQKNIKLVNIPCFDSSFVDKTYGLWILARGGLMDCSKKDYKREYSEEFPYPGIDPRLNHFSPHGHQILTNNIIPHIKTYITTDQDFHISLLYPELFA